MTLTLTIAAILSGLLVSRGAVSCYCWVAQAFWSYEQPGDQQ